MMDLRRKIALWVCPSLKDLPYNPKVAGGVARSSRHQQFGDNIRQLDRIFIAETGVVLNFKTAPNYNGRMYQWPSSRENVRRSVVNALLRLRRGPNGGVQATTEFLCRNYFSDIWPLDLEWPRGINRPKPTKKKEAA